MLADADLESVRVESDRPRVPGVRSAKEDALADASQACDVRGEVLGRGEVVEELVDRVGSEMRRHRRAATLGEIEVATVDEGLVKLSARPEARVLIRAPGPHRRARVG